jgi:hypothetical protein
VVRGAYRPGDWFAVPLRNGGFAVGLIARANRQGVLFGYFFGPRREAVPGLDEVGELGPADAVLVGRFGHLGLKRGTWPIIGRSADWRSADWPMPALVRYEELTGRSFQVFYDDDDPNKLVREVAVPPGVAEQAPKDGLMGAGFVETVLTRSLE